MMRIHLESLEIFASNRLSGSPIMPQAVDSPTDRPTKDQCSVMVTNLKIIVVNLYSTGLTRGYAGKIGIQMVANNLRLNRERCKRGKKLNRKYNLQDWPTNAGMS